MIRVSWRWVGSFLLVVAFVTFTANFRGIPELMVYSVVFGTMFLYLFHRNPYYCLNFFIVWLPLQTFTLSLMAVSDIFSDQLIVFLTSLKELALAMLLITLLKKRLILRGRLSVVEYLFLLNVILVLVYAVLPDSFFGVSSDLKVKVFGLRSALVTLAIFLVGRYVPYDPVRVIKAIRLLCGVCVLVLLFGIVEVLLIPRETFISGFVPYSLLKGEDLINLENVDFTYVVEYTGFTFKRMMSFFLSPLGLAYFMIFPFVSVLSDWSQKEATDRRAISHSGVLLVVIALAILLSGTRGVIFIIPILITIVYARRHLLKALVLFGLLVLILAVSPMKTVLTDTVNLEDSSSRGHAYAYTVGIESVINHPLGIGLGQAGPTAVWIKGATGTYGSGDDASIGESVYLTIAMERGLLGLGFFILFVSYIARAGKRLGDLSADRVMAVLGKSVFLSTVAFMFASIPTEHWLAFQSAAIYWWFAGLVVKCNAQGKL